MICKTVNLCKEDLRSLKALLWNYLYHLLRRYNGIEHEKYIEYVIEILKTSSFESKKHILILAKHSAKTDGLIMLKKLDWDFRYFGIPMGRIEYLIANGAYQKSVNIKIRLLRTLFQECKCENVRHLTARVDIEDISSIHALEETGFKLMTTEHIGIIDKKSSQFLQIKPVNGLIIRKFRKSDLAEIVKIGKDISSSVYSRFAFDPGLRFDKSRRYYIKVTQNIYSYADRIFVGVKDNKIIGFIAYKLFDELFTKIIKRKMAFVVLGGILSSQRRKGIGTFIFGNADRFLLKEVDAIMGRVYLHNIPMFEFIKKQRDVYQSLTIQHCFHKFLE